MSAELPSPEVRATIIERLSELIIAIEAHPAWNPENPHRGLFHVWDFVSRSRYIMTELDHIRDGEPVQYPEQIRQQSGGRQCINPPVTRTRTRTRTRIRAALPADRARAGHAERAIFPTNMGVPGLSTGPAAAAESFADVCGRAVTVNELVSTPRLLTMMGLPQIDYGSDVTSKSQAVVEVVNQVR
ncbi:hypothetical protein GQ607_009557 [Colletotrichum asianum]|uniref:Uncharacterized protein n=1 Tax=Colletotrichum asianum TaxID=702518 RepID=A0A8H3W8D1_9PEZI|nr:hypothetical protein GQ607_009557 [Colletotrichum asianum]